MPAGRDHRQRTAFSASGRDGHSVSDTDDRPSDLAPADQRTQGGEIAFAPLPRSTLAGTRASLGIRDGEADLASQIDAEHTHAASVAPGIAIAGP
jgi:hypothetical protein